MKRFSLLPLIVIAFWTSAPSVTEAALVRREVPVRFNFPASYAPLHLDSGWVTFPLNPILQEMHGYIHANAVPYTFDACAKLVFAFEAGDVWAGNTFACQVWMESYDAPDLTEIRSDFGCDFGVELREQISHLKLNSFTKDFRLAVEGNGGLPLGNKLLGGWDTLEFASLPIDELVPGSETVKALVQSCLNFADANGLSIGTLELMGEMVVQGHYLRVRVGETDVELTQPGVAHAQTAFVYVPLELGETMADVFEIPLFPVYNFSIWKGMGAKLTAVGPLSINLAPDNFDLDRLLPGAYVPPDLATVTSRYQQAVTQASATLRETPWLAFPISGRPPFPDLVVHDVVVNPDEPQAHGRAYANEPTKIGFTLSNIGGAATQLTDDMVVYFFIEGKIIETRILNNMGASPRLVLNTNASVRLSFEYQFDEGPHAAEIRAGICSLKGYADGQPVYGLGDPFLGNNGRPFQVYCAPARGSIIGRVFSNPSGPGEGIDGIRVRLSGLNRTAETVSAYDAVADSHGIYRFERVYPGDYMVEYLTDAPTNNVGPRYYPRSIHFRHDFGVTDLREGSGMFMRQYQRLHGRVCDSNSNPVPGARITLGDSAFLETHTDTGGFFVITNVPPSGSFVVVVDHSDFLIRRVQFDMDVTSTAQTDTYPSGYFSLPDMTWISGYTIILEEDTEPPVVELLPFENDGRRGNPLLFQFHGSDQDGRCAPAEYRWQVRNTGGTVVLQGPWTPWPTNAPPGNVATAVADLSSLSDFTYSFRILARDRARNESITAAQNFTLDKMPPLISVTVAEGAAVTSSRLVPVDIVISNTEPGTLMLELSNDGTTWSEPWFFSGSAFHVSAWELTHLEACAGFTTVTVRARVTDAVGLQTIASDSIDLAAVGAVRLAGGWEAWTNTIVPLLIDIVPPDGVLQKQLSTWAGTLKVGGDPLARYRAQAFILTDNTTFNRIRLGLFRVVGEPAPLTLRVVNTLDDADPTGEAGAVWSWTGTAEEIRFAAMRNKDGMPPATSGDGTVLPAGTNYIIFVCEEVDPDKYYEFSAGSHRFNHDEGLRYDHNGTSWVAGPEVPPGMGVPTFTLLFYHSPNGEIRICTDGVMDTEPWVAFSYPAGRFCTVNAPGEGLFTTIVAYSNAVDTSRNGTHYDSVFIDFTPPVIHDISILSIDTAARGVLLNLNVTDAVTRVAGMRWRFDNGPWQVDPFQSKPFLYCPPSFSTMTWSFYDAAGNETAPQTFSLPVDMSAPTLTASIANGRDYTIGVKVPLQYAAYDDTAVDHITLRESRTDTVYNSLLNAEDKIEITLPKVVVERDGRPRYAHVDGTYTFELVAYDSSGNASEPVLLPIILDRERPRLDAVELVGTRGEAPVSDTNLVLRLRVEDNLGPMEMRWRWQDGTWSVWQPIASGRFGLPLAGFLPLPRSYAVDVQVRDAARLTVNGSASVAVNRPPYTPVGIRPEYATGDPPFLFGSDFRDPDNDPWGASQFAVSARGEIVLDTGVLYGSDRYHVPAGWLRQEEKYQWRCRYFDPYGAASPWSEWKVFDLHEDSDGDGIPDDIEQRNGTAWDDPDSDGDGIPDGLEDLNANGIVDEGETNPLRRDSDRDGLDDGEEDLNLNGRLDSGETSPWLPDTDDDGASDLHERRSGTDPRDPSALFRITSFQQMFPDGRRRLVWQARDGYSYDVLAHEDLSGTVPPQVVTNLTAKGGFPPWYVVPLEWTEPTPSVSARFYSIRLKE